MSDNKKVVYICHPISGNVGYNTRSVRQIMRHIYQTEPDVVPFAPYLTTLQVLDDKRPEQRKLGIESNKTFLKRGCVDEMWLYGDRISDGMAEEIMIALFLGIKIYAMTEGTLRGVTKLTGKPSFTF